MTGGTARVLPIAAAAGAVLLSGCQSAGTPAAPPASTAAGTAVTSAAPTTSRAPVTSSASGRGTPLGVFEVTCHTGPGVTASGRPSSREVVSVDRRLVPFGTRLFIDEVGLRVAADTGPAMVGRRLDIWEPSAAACVKFDRKRLQVWQTPRASAHAPRTPEQHLTQTALPAGGSTTASGASRRMQPNRCTRSAAWSAASALCGRVARPPSSAAESRVPRAAQLMRGRAASPGGLNGSSQTLHYLGLSGPWSTSPLLRS